MFAGARFVATRDVQGAASRRGRLFGDPARGSYLGVAWVLPGKQAEWDAWVGREMETIAAEGRLFAGPRSRAHRGVPLRVAVGCRRRDRRARPRLPRRDRRRRGAGDARASTCPVDVVPVQVRLRLERTIVSAGRPAARTTSCSALVRGRPARHLRGALAHGLAGGGFASPFLATVPGTDTYADDL